MAKSRVPDLTFPEAKFNAHQIPWDLSYMLYKDAAGIPAREFGALGNRQRGTLLEKRQPLVFRLHQILQAKIVSGTSRATLDHYLYALRIFFRWADAFNITPTIASVEGDFLHWSEHLLQQPSSTRSIQTAYDYARTLGNLFDELCDSKVKLLSRTHFPRKSLMSSKKKTIGKETDKQNISDTFVFGRFLIDVINGLTAEAIFGDLPVRIRLRSGQSLEEWSGLMPAENVKSLSSTAPSWDRRRITEKRKKWNDDRSLRTRHTLTTLRVEAELLTFMACSGMNLSQARTLQVGQFNYASSHNGYEVRRIFKDRRRGEVEFSIYSEYRHIFERYLEWRKAVFPTDERLFPRWNYHGKSDAADTPFNSVRTRCKRLGIKFCGAQILRNTQINWLLRRTSDTKLTAEMAQHAEQTLIRVYEKPNHQRAINEISRFHSISDPAMAAAGPGVCAGKKPEPFDESPSDAPKPDCVSPAGCLFCQHQRDLDTEDHVWSLASYRYLKSLELSKYRPPQKDNAQHPAKAAIDRLSEKLKVIREIDSRRNEWVEEASTRVVEGTYHPAWDVFIQLTENRNGYQD
ncbi:hypothetical protein SAMN05443245_7021 [Paraburkholderia fungorum]|uniref:Integrase n=1 Tax=Paraburkholderia fungorum TaxID=134537 RepID=A0A1H1JP56_9BURK|nr:site-specific integrase [Paraburkholderia fungorum]SDR51786.1 hypothetical protein SAMN05443245_7021 [Paraburkholderia fungorum]